MDYCSRAPDVQDDEPRKGCEPGVSRGLANIGSGVGAGSCARLAAGIAITNAAHAQSRPKQY